MNSTAFAAFRAAVVIWLRGGPACALPSGQSAGEGRAITMRLSLDSVRRCVALCVLLAGAGAQAESRRPGPSAAARPANPRVHFGLMGVRLAGRRVVRVDVYYYGVEREVIAGFTPDDLRTCVAPRVVTDPARIREVQSDLAAAIPRCQTSNSETGDDSRLGCVMWDNRNRVVASVFASANGSTFSLDGRPCTVEGPLYLWLKGLTRRYVPEEWAKTDQYYAWARAQAAAARSKRAIALPKYRITDLGAPGGIASFGYAINNAGHVAGQLTTRDGAGHLFLWRRGRMRRLKSFGSARLVQPNDMNDADDIVGLAVVANRGDIPFLWKDGVMRDLGTLGKPAEPGDEREASAINARGAVVGRQPDKEHIERAFLWTRQAGAVPIDVQGATFGQAFGISDAGLVVGSAVRPRGRYEAFTWRGGVTRFLGTLGGSYSHAVASNSSGWVIGYSVRRNTESSRTFLWHNGRMVELGAPKGFDGATARDINDSGGIVGAAQAGLTRSHAVLWKGGRVFDLNDLIPRGSGWILEDALGINRRGQITGSGTHNGRHRAYLLTPR